jgi:hypothetical protein
MRTLAILLFCLPVQFGRAQDKIAPPDAESLQKATALVRELYKEKYEAATTAEQKQALAAELLKKAKMLQNDAATRYVILRDAGSYSVKAADMKLAFQVVEEMDRTFQIDAAKMKVAVVDAIQATWATEKPAATRLRLEISESGDGKFHMEAASNQPDDFSGTPFQLNRWPRTKATKGPDELYRLIHDFRDPDDLDVLTGLNHNVKADTSQGVLAFTPGPMPEGWDVRNGAAFNYRKAFVLPATISCDIATLGDGVFAMRLSGQIGLLNCTITSSQDGKIQSQVSLITRDQSGKNSITVLAAPQPAGRTFERAFRLPGAGGKITDRFGLELGQANGQGPTTISRLEVRGRILPSFGMGLVQKDAAITVNKVMPKTVAEEAGVRAGDVLMSIGGQRATTVQETLAILQGRLIGEDTVFVFERDKKPLTIRMVAE